ncbi:MAG: epoxyqueuosine reductase [Methanoregulaceae archaeon]|nr:epoxyqueuosine reductase [Methanoregulaceae archaeon]
MNLADRLRDLSQRNGCNYFGIGDLGAAREFIRDQGGDTLAEYPLAVSAGIRLLDTLVDLLPDRDTNPSAAALYRSHAYEVVNTQLDLAALAIAGSIQEEGFRALPIPASKRTDNARICGPFSHKLAAHLAGLGWIGKNCLLITRDHGPRVRWTTVLTNAPIVPTGKPMKPRCGVCQECETACPVHAIRGIIFDPSEPRETRLDAAICERYYTQMEKGGGEKVCGMCLYSCPYGRISR